MQQLLNIISIGIAKENDIFSSQMISTRYVSFLSGIIIASLTWAFSLYLYSRLSQNTITASPTMLVPGISSQALKESLFKHGEYSEKDIMLRDNVIIPRNEKQTMIGKKTYNLKDNKDYKNDNLLLQPVPVKPAVTLDQGVTVLMP